MQSLREALWSSGAPEGSAAAMERTIEIAVQRLGRPGPAPTRRLRRRSRVLAVVVGVVVALLALTPQGRDAVGAAAEQGSQLFGIGEVGGPPTKGAEVPMFSADSPKIVLATGETADGVPFEIVAYRSNRRIESPDADETTVCVNTEFPAAESDGLSGCYSGALNYGGLCCSQLLFDEEATSVPYIEGQVAPRVESVVIRYIDEARDQREAEAVIGMITPRFASTLEVEHPSGVFIASLPGLATADAGRFRGAVEPIEVTALTENGAVVETETYPAIRDRGAPRECRHDKEALCD
jgi:hypothetical protein